MHVSAQSENELETKSSNYLVENQTQIWGWTSNQDYVISKTSAVAAKIPKCFSLSACLQALLP